VVVVVVGESPDFKIVSLYGISMLFGLGL